MRIGIVSATLGHVPNSFRMTTPSAVDHAAGRNTGNLAFRHAVDLHIESPKVHVPWDADVGWVREQCDLLVIPSANQAHPGMDFSRRADFLESADLPCLALGLGAQAPSSRPELTLKCGTIRYLQAISERSLQIGVRGEYTASMLARIGITNTVVVGCPSNFINPSRELGTALEQKLRGRIAKRLVVTAGDLRPEQRSIERKLFKWVVACRGAYVCQSNLDLIALARNRLTEVTGEQVRQLRQYLRPINHHPTGRGRFLELVRHHFRVFFDVGAWLEFLSCFDLSMGTRLHGNLLAIQAETPGICIHHDARTEELCRTTNMPHLSMKEFTTAKRLPDLVDMTRFDGIGFDQQRILLARQYRELLIGCGIKVCNDLNQLTKINSRGSDQDHRRSRPMGQSMTLAQPCITNGDNYGAP